MPTCCASKKDTSLKLSRMMLLSVLRSSGGRPGKESRQEVAGSLSFSVAYTASPLEMTPWWDGMGEGGLSREGRTRAMSYVVSFTPS